VTSSLRSHIPSETSSAMLVLRWTRAGRCSSFGVENSARTGPSVTPIWLKAILGTKVFLDVRVSVHQGWREDERFLDELEWPLG
jgi:hypothetical protein